MWQMGGPGPMFGQVHHFVKYNKGKGALCRGAFFSKRALRLYWRARPQARPTASSSPPTLISIADIAIWPVGLALRVADGRPQPISERQTLVHDHRQSPGGAEGLQGPKGRGRDNRCP